MVKGEIGKIDAEGMIVYGLDLGQDFDKYLKTNRKSTNGKNV